MSAMHFRFTFCRVIFLGAMTFAALRAEIGLAQQTSDPADGAAIKQSATAALQKNESYVREAVRSAQRASGADMGKAIEILNAALTRLESDSAIGAERRSALGRMLKSRIHILEAESNRPS